MVERRPVLLTVSGSIPADLDESVDAGKRPRADYRVMQHHFDADVVDVDDATAASGLVGRSIRRLLGTGAVLAWYCFRHRHDYEVIVTDGEQVGIPLAMLSRLTRSRGARHMMIVHILTTRSKSLLMRSLRLARRIDRYLVYCSRQRDLMVDGLGVPADRIVLSTFMVDTDFFDPATAPPSRHPIICSAGLERRDYPTLMRAVDGLDVKVVIAAASPWSKQSDSSGEVELPANVTVRRLDLFELRELYAAAQFVVMPLYDVDFQAGITTILEAQAMARPVVCTRTPGQTDTVIEGTTGRYVDPDDPDGLRRVIVDLLDDPVEVERLGAAAREWTVRHADVERYAERLADVVTGLRAT